jgi:hypothetical protein
MIDTSAPLRAALADFGTLATIGLGPGTLRVRADLDTSASFAGETIRPPGPAAIALLADVLASGLEAGNEGDQLTINATAYTLLAIDPDGQGGVVLTLQEAA